MTGIQDVAREVGLSTATVSRALRGLPGVSAETRHRVQEVSQRMGYVPYAAASVLASGQTRTIAVVVPFVTRWYFGEVVEGAESVLRARGYDVLLYNLSGDPQARHRVLSTHLLTKRVDGILVLGVEPTPSEQEWLAGHAPPIGMVGGSVPGIPTVRIDDREAALIAMRHLIGLGHRRIGYVGGSEIEPLNFSTPRSRRAGYQQALREAGVDLDPALETWGHFTVEGGIDAGHALLGLDSAPTAIFCASDEMAWGVLRAAMERGVPIPEALSVIGIDDHALSRFTELTTVRQPVAAMGRAAAERLLAQLGGARIEEQDLLLPTELIVRGTTAPPPARLSRP
jgi:DNA-binding LacI/PurR family transcriptional regulator